ncbi:hypothetical protein CRG98_028151 [Punica granatum]|uniref:Trichome birefringence-like C-terminal domain-containing protein n=1 Tax=Punica granatum TaxID=22663 RepID=A0A2I0J689_PUNGR|nr:hypothetical protein CRG98_028151 [Punica granatum]
MSSYTHEEQTYGSHQTPELPPKNITWSPRVTFVGVDWIFMEYNASIESYWAPLLVESNSNDPVHHNLSNRIVRVQAIENHARHWSDADILVFDTYLWWTRYIEIKVLWGSFESPDGIYKDVKMLLAYEMALTTWSQWLEIHPRFLEDPQSCGSRAKPFVRTKGSCGPQGYVHKPRANPTLGPSPKRLGSHLFAEA